MVEMFSNTLALEKMDIRNFSDNVDGNYDKMFENIYNGKEMTVIIITIVIEMILDQQLLQSKYTM